MGLDYDKYNDGLMEESFDGRKGHKEKKQRKNNDKRGEGLIAEDLTDIWKAKPGEEAEVKTEPMAVKVEEKPEGKNENAEGNNKEKVWYPELPRQLVEVTRGKYKDEEDTDFLEKRKKAYTELEERIPQIRKVVKEFKYQVYWAGKILGGYKKPTLWGDPQKGLDFLEAKLGIVKIETSNPTKKKMVEEKKAPEKKNEALGSDLTFDEKMKKISETHGILMTRYKEYLNGGGKSEVYDHAVRQLRTAFPSFDLNEFAEEARKRHLENKTKVVESQRNGELDWKEVLDSDSDLKMLSELVKKINPDVWQNKVELLSKMREKERGDQLLVLRALIRIRATGKASPAAMRLWDKQKTRLEELGLMI